jgi:NNP family nitrate/nitrite transporter-like MFS transporter
MPVTTPGTVTPAQQSEGQPSEVQQVEAQQSEVQAGTAIERAPGRWITRWDPEDAVFWDGGGRRVARRNLVFSILAEHLGFSVWVLWSIVVTYLPQAGFALTVGQTFWLISLPPLVGATLRLPYTFAVGRFGGRNWTIVSALLLVVPAAGLAWAVNNPATPFWVLLVIAGTAGFGGGNFASSMTNITYFFPVREQGWALGLNAAGGNIGVAVVQAPIIVAAVVVAGGGLHLWRAGAMWIPLALVSAFLAWRYMDNLTTAKSDFASSAAAARRGQTWVMSLLYVGTFGSFMGFAFAFPTLIKTQFPEVAVADFAFLGALVGSLARPLGGRLSDRMGGARVTAASFVVMGTGVLWAVAAVRSHDFASFLTAFMLLFVATGVGNGSTYRMIPAIFAASTPDRATARRQGAAAIGIISAIGAYGGFLVPQTFRWSVEHHGSIIAALYVYVGVYAVMLVVTWAFYLRRGAAMAKVGV